MLDHVLVYVNGRRHEVRGRDVFLSLSDFLRRRLGLIGTKIVCSEGDCGACSVLVGRAAADGSRLEYRPVDSCIQFLFQLDSTHVVTIEGIGGEESPSAVQQAMVECHGSQCGFCTPGFVVAMTGLLEDRDELSEASMRGGLTGNLCRCTGYTAIIESGRQVDVEKHERMAKRYPAEAMISEFAARRSQPMEVRAECESRLHECSSPVDLVGAVAFLKEHPDAVIVAGATDVGVRVNKTMTVPVKVLDLNRVVELTHAAFERDELVVGARTSWATLEGMCEARVPEFYKILRVFGAPQIRNVGTIGGNIANGSPIADSLPFLFVCNAVIELASVEGTRCVPIVEFYKGYKQFDMRPGELIARVRVPLPAEGEALRLYKVSRRKDLDISTFTAAVRVRLDGETITAAAVAFGGVGPTVIRARQTEKFLRGRVLDEETMRLAGDVAVREISPISDVRGAAEYRSRLARNVLMKFYGETQSLVEPV